MINIKAGIQHLKELTQFYRQGGEVSRSLQEDLKILNEKLRRIYDVVRNDPNYMKHNYKASANAIQAMMNDQADYRNYNQEGEDSEQDE